VAGVCAGLGRRFGVDPLVPRVLAVLAAALGGAGVVLYALGWALMSAEPRPAGAVRTRTGSWQVGAGVALLALSALLFLRAAGLLFAEDVLWPLVLAAGGVALVWRQTAARPLGPLVPAGLGGRAPVLPGAPLAPGTAADPAAVPPAGADPADVSTGGEGAALEGRPEVVARERDADRLASLYRGGFGVALIAGSGLLVLQTTGALSAARELLLATVVITVGLALVLAPFLWRIGQSLAAERAARIRSEERAEVAAHLHDSVLQTLALVQKRADDPRAVAALARRQERELRSWLSGERPADPDQRFAAALEAAATEVEEAHGARVELVAVGDAPLDERARATVGAAREAMVNAAKFAGEAGPVAVFAEATDRALEVFVRDRGPGFDPGAVPADRRGVRESIVGRMARHGGEAVVHAAPGAGVEVELRMQRDGDPT
jgi:signal transduction histidine kinase/phage shock protein PspC (stress-responsive transcriptional regulator)